jgi:hypothetical protein
MERVGPTDNEEIADIIFKSDSSELSDLLLKSKKYNYDIDNLVGRITATINGDYGMQLNAGSFPTSNRKEYLFKRIKNELAYYSHNYEK